MIYCLRGTIRGLNFNKNAGDCDLSKSVKIGEQRDQLFRDANFPTHFFLPTLL
jgi:hypothetical protein